MKVRTGFVSNSSSSSFVVAFKTLPTSREELKQMLWGDEEVIAAYDQGITTEKAAQTVWRDYSEALQTPLTVDDIANEVKEGYYDSPEHPRPEDYSYRVDWKPENMVRIKALQAQHNAMLLKQGRAVADQFMSQNAGATFLRFSYADEDGPYFCTLEHGPTFNAIPHLRISHH